MELVKYCTGASKPINPRDLKLKERLMPKGIEVQFRFFKHIYA